MYDPCFAVKAWEQYLEWLNKDKRIFNRINALIKDIQRNGLMVGIGKPEMLRYYETSTYSRHINEEHRLVYEAADGQTLRIISCKGHYEE